MSENSPAPTPGRGVYGFALYLGCVSLSCLYIVWALFPDSVLHHIGITYYPQKYWAVALPVYVLMCIALFTFFLYPSLNAMLVPSLDSIRTITDQHSHLERCTKESGKEKAIPPAGDIDISHVCSMLYNQ